MPGYFVVTTEVVVPTNVFKVRVTVTSYDGFKGHVTMTYSYDDDYDTPLSIDPQGGSLHVPQNGYATDDVEVDVDVDDLVRFVATGNWNQLQDTSTEDLRNSRHDPP